MGVKVVDIAMSNMTVTKEGKRKWKASSVMTQCVGVPRENVLARTARVRGMILAIGYLDA